MEVNSGFKATEAGVVPLDWEVNPLENFTSFISYGFTNPMPTAESGIYMITAKDINRGRIQFDSARCTTEEAYRTLLTAKSRPKSGDVLLTKDGTLGRLALVDDTTVCINQSVAIIRPNQKADPKFLKMLLEAPRYQSRMIEDAGGSTIKHIYITIVNKMPLALPSAKAEQEAIANALGDADSLIESLEQLIVKKRNLKQGAMQELLTGKLRLPGFGKLSETQKTEVGFIPTDWVVCRLKTVCEIAAGRDLVKDEFSRAISSGHPYPIYSNALTSRGLYGYSSSYQYESDKITVTARGDVGHAMYRNTRFCAIGRLLVMSAKQPCDLRFVTEYINTFVEFALESTGVPQLTAPQIGEYQIAMPPTKNEQTEIADVLSDMDCEIGTLESKLTKAKQIKQGMMQELLTGRIRLV